jgi:hypothetical protein
MSHRNSHHGSPSFVHGSLVELCEASHGFPDETVFRVDDVTTVGGKFFVNVTSLEGRKCRFVGHELGLHECDTCPHAGSFGTTGLNSSLGSPS